ncbi:MAG: PHP domain-containing protein [Candidatus Poribacteria bacterium]
MNFGIYEYKGAIHIHSKYSDGGCGIKGIVKEAQKAGLDYIILTDHESLQALKDGYEGWYDNVLLLVGEEITPRGGYHYLALGIETEIIGKQFIHAQHFIDRVSASGGIGIIAHPFGSKTRLLEIRKNSWQNWDVEGYTGMEIWSYMIDWIDNVTPLTLPKYYFYPDKAIDGPKPESLKKWDEIAQERRVVGIGSLDAHGRPTPLLWFLKPLSYEHLFETIRTHILTTAPLIQQSLNESKKLVYDAIRAGRCFSAYDFLADSTGFRFAGLMNKTIPILMGDEVDLDGNVSLHASVPAPAELRLIRNGKQVKSEYSKKIEFETGQTGAYRVEVYYDNRPWIFSNHIFLR